MHWWRVKCGSSSTLTVLLFRVSERPSTGVWSLRGKPGPGGLLAEKPQPPAHRTGQPLCPGPWGPTFRNACGDHCPGPSVPASIHALRHLLRQRGYDHRACDPLTRSAASAKGHLPAASMPMVGRALYPRGRRGEAGGSRGALLIMQASGDLGPATQPPRPPGRDTQAGRAPAHWAVETLSSL